MLNGASNIIRRLTYLRIQKDKFIKLILKMNLNIPLNFRNQGCLPIWDYTSMVMQLEKIYCLCPPSNESLPHLDSFCTNLNHLLSSTEDVVNSHSEQSPQENSEANEQIKTQPSEKQTESENIQSQVHFQKTQAQEEEAKKNQIDKRVISARRRCSSRFNIRARLVRMRNRILKDPTCQFEASSKKLRGTDDMSLGRRSRYIGISRNNSNWQALINVKNVKKYIGTFDDEIEAAKTYDIFAIATRREKALLNFSYTAQEMLSAIDHFLEHRTINTPS
ncbi:unnamed protein product [Moneuplotes crassus]|uniref:AP2/ERF domain-containing protein n=1 Tax=Euplotes crassus TaxID=5936 RepID=A0AAD1Y6I7_EUPCR|nr:unnamed protein product [Moneuplotes crassus]